MATDLKLRGLALLSGPDLAPTLTGSQEDPQVVAPKCDWAVLLQTDQREKYVPRWRVTLFGRVWAHAACLCCLDQEQADIFGRLVEERPHLREIHACKVDSWGKGLIVYPALGDRRLVEVTAETICSAQRSLSELAKHSRQTHIGRSTQALLLMAGMLGAGPDEYKKGGKR